MDDSISSITPPYIWNPHPEEPIARANGIGGEDLLRPDLRREIEAHVERRKDSIEATRRYFRGEPTSDPCEPESPKPDAPEYHGGFMSPERAQKLESDLAAARAIFPKICDALGNGACCTKDASIEFLAEIPNEVRLVIEAKDRELKRLRAALEDMERKVTWNRQIRDSLVKLFKEAGWQDDCTLIDQLTNMNLDALAPASPNLTPDLDGWRPIETVPIGKEVLLHTPFEIGGASHLCYVGRIVKGIYDHGCSHWMPLPTAPASSGKGEG